MKITSRAVFGFSLIEIIVTISIVAILAVISIPTMNKYITRSKVADVILATSGLQTLVSTQIVAIESVTNSSTSLVLPTSLGRYVSIFAVSPDGVISLTTTNAAKSISLILTPSYNSNLEKINWTCAVTNADFNDYVPKDCRI